jgi:hypothetical protein
VAKAPSAPPSERAPVTVESVTSPHEPPAHEPPALDPTVAEQAFTEPPALDPTLTAPFDDEFAPDATLGLPGYSAGYPAPPNPPYPPVPSAPRPAAPHYAAAPYPTYPAGPPPTYPTAYPPNVVSAYPGPIYPDTGDGIPVPTYPPVVSPPPLYPPPVYPPPIYPPYATTAPSSRTNTLAIVSLVLVFFFWPAAIVCGHIARSQIRRTGDGGRGLTTAALIIGYGILSFWTLIITLGVIGFTAA